MTKNYFYFKGKMYSRNTIVKIYQKYEGNFNFYSYLKFYKYDDFENVYYFSSLYSEWEMYKIQEDKLCEYVEEISVPYYMEVDSVKKVSPNNLEGMTTALIWYILIMFFALFLKGAHNIICLQILSSYIFFSWRHRKMNGG